MNKKTSIYFGPPLARLTEAEGNTLEISGRINRTAERYLALMNHHGVPLSGTERDCLKEICQMGFMSPEEIAELPEEVEREGASLNAENRSALAAKLRGAAFVDLVAVVEELGF